jgi:hypothetical protein
MTDVHALGIVSYVVLIALFAFLARFDTRLDKALFEVIPPIVNEIAGVPAAKPEVDPQRSTALIVQKATLKTLSGFFLLLLVSLLINLWMEDRKAHARVSRRTLDEARAHFKDRFLRLNHRHDEAVGGLMRLSKAKASEFWYGPPSTNMLAVMYISKVMSFVAFMSIGAVLLAANAGIRPSILSLSWLGELSGFYMKPGQLGIAATFMVMSIAAWVIFVVSIAIIYRTLRVGLVGLAKVSDWFVSGRIAQISLGANVPGQSAFQVDASPSWIDKGFGWLPEELARQVAQFDDNKSSELVSRLREVLHRALEPNADFSELSVGRISEVLELLHTRYFDVAVFRKFVCYAIAHSPGFRPSEKLSADPDYEKLGQWLREVQSGAGFGSAAA